MRIGYIVHNLNDPAVERRCEMLNRGGAEVVLAGFSRDETLAPAPARRNAHMLGRSHDAAMLQRASATVGNAVFAGRLKRLFADCDVVMARNLEQLAIARAIIGKRALVYECLDIHRLLTGKSLPARAVQAVEARLLRRAQLLLTSSPAFVRNHFSRRAIPCPIELIENKLLIPEDQTIEPRQPPSDEPITIGWFGMLRCRRTMAFLSGLAASCDGRIRILVAGRPSPAELPDFAAQCAKVPHLEFTGPYGYEDLPRLYGRCHFAWTIDWFEEGLNSSWLLPNRLYESLAHGAVPIALADVEVGRWLSQRDAGLVVADADEAAMRLRAMQPPELAALQGRVRSFARADLIAKDAECRQLVDLVEQAMGR